MADDTFSRTACLGKHGYPDPQSAHRAARRIKSKSRRRFNGKKQGGKSGLQVYRCSVCGLHHIGGHNNA